MGVLDWLPQGGLGVQQWLSACWRTPNQLPAQLTQLDAPEVQHGPDILGDCRNCWGVAGAAGELQELLGRCRSCWRVAGAAGSVHTGRLEKLVSDVSEGWQQ